MTNKKPTKRIKVGTVVNFYPKYYIRATIRIKGWFEKFLLDRLGLVKQNRIYTMDIENVKRGKYGCIRETIFDWKGDKK